MKIRLGFVSNSSSSSYIVAIPDNFKIDDKELNEWAENMLQDYRKIKTIDKAIKCIKDNLNELKNDGNLYSNDTPGFCAIQEILEQKGFIIDYLNGAADGQDIIMNVGCDKTLKKIRKIMEI